MVENPEPPERRATRASEKAKKAAEADEKQQLIDRYRGMLMTGKDEELKVTPGVIQDKNRRELDEVLARMDAGMEDSYGVRQWECGSDSVEEERQVNKEIVEDLVDEESQNLFTGQGDARAKTDLVEESEIKTEEQCEENTGGQKVNIKIGSFDYDLKLR